MLVNLERQIKKKTGLVLSGAILKDALTSKDIKVTVFCQFHLNL